MAHTHQTLLQEWRDRSTRGQAEARRVIAEMLTPSGGSRTNCHKFVSWVTGRSLTTIGKVNDQMKKTGMLSVSRLNMRCSRSCVIFLLPTYLVLQLFGNINLILSLSLATLLLLLIKGSIQITI